MPGSLPLLLLAVTTLRNRFGSNGIFGEVPSRRRRRLTFGGHFFDALLARGGRAEIVEMLGRAAATTNNFPDAKRTIIIVPLFSLECHLALMDSRQIDRRSKSVQANSSWHHEQYKKVMSYFLINPPSPPASSPPKVTTRATRIELHHAVCVESGISSPLTSPPARHSALDFYGVIRHLLSGHTLCCCCNRKSF